MRKKRRGRIGVGRGRTEWKGQDSKEEKRNHIKKKKKNSNPPITSRSSISNAFAPNRTNDSI